MGNRQGGKSGGKTGSSTRTKIQSSKKSFPRNKYVPPRKGK